jgi:hypothetical protein
MSARGLSAMLWFRADPSRDTEVALALRRVAEALAPVAPIRIGHRHEEDRPYRTWMIDAGPVAPDRYEAVLWRLHKAVFSAGVRAFSQASPHLESFEWLEDAELGGHPADPPCPSPAGD